LDRVALYKAEKSEVLMMLNLDTLVMSRYDLWQSTGGGTMARILSQGAELSKPDDNDGPGNGKPSLGRRALLGRGGVLAAGVVGAGAVATAIAPPASAQSTTGGFNVVTDFGATGDGVTDDTQAIQNAIWAAEQAAYATISGGANTSGSNLVGTGPVTVEFPDGVYAISKPLLIQTGVFTNTDDTQINCVAQGITLKGLGGPGATGGGGGTGSVSDWDPGSDTGSDQIQHGVMAGAVIAPLPAFSSSGAGLGGATYNASACVLVDGTGSLSGVNTGDFYRVTVDSLTIYGGGAGLTTVHGVASYGAGDALKITNCLIFGFYSASSNGIYLLPDTLGDDPTYAIADGTAVYDTMIQFLGHDAVHGPFGDGYLRNVHVQEIGGYGFYISNADIDSQGADSGANTRLDSCRADECGVDGFYINVSTADDGTAICLTNCGTQGNNENGINISSAESTKTSPVYVSSSYFQGDGQNGSSGGIRIAGPSYASFAACGVHVQIGSSNYPTYGMIVTENGTGQASPSLTFTGFLNGQTSALLVDNAPKAANFQCTYLSGGAFTYSSSPSSYSYSGSGLSTR
jgi:Pectate lyase superfamily protein